MLTPDAARREARERDICRADLDLAHWWTLPFLAGLVLLDLPLMLMGFGTDDTGGG